MGGGYRKIAEARDLLQERRRLPLIDEFLLR